MKERRGAAGLVVLAILSALGLAALFAPWTPCPLCAADTPEKGYAVDFNRACCRGTLRMSPWSRLRHPRN